MVWYGMNQSYHTLNSSLKREPIPPLPAAFFNAISEIYLMC